MNDLRQTRVVKHAGLLFALIGLLSGVPSCRQGQTCRPEDPGCQLSALWLFSPLITEERVVAVGSGGMVYYSRDRGKTWTAGVSGSALDLTGVAYAGNNRWVAVGLSDRMVISDDGGQTWRPSTVPSTGGVNHQSLAYGNNTLLAAGTLGNIFISRDRGVTWSAGSAAVAAVKNNADFICSTLIFASNAQVAFTQDGVNATVATTQPAFPTGKGACKGTRMIIATGNAPYSAYSDDGGVNWTGGGAAIPGIRRTVRLGGTQLFAFGDDLTMQVSSDATSWTAAGSLPVGFIKDSVPFSAQHILAVGGSGSATVIYTENGGQSWTQVSGFPAQQFNAVAYGRISLF